MTRSPFRSSWEDALPWVIVVAGIALLIAGIVFVEAHEDDDRNVCKARGGVYHCTSSTAVGFNTGKGGGVTVTPVEQCDCYTPDGRVLLPDKDDP